MYFSKLNAKLVTALCLLVCACATDKNRVGLIDKNFSDEIGPRQNLVFKFDHDLCPDSLLNRWDSVQYIKITPLVKGSFMFTSRRELQFSPSFQFEPCMAYKAEITNALLHRADKRLHVGDIPAFDFHTPYLKMEAAEAFWVRSDKGADEIAMMVNIGFNYRVEPGEISRLMKISANKKEMPFTMVTNSIDYTMVIKVDGLQKELAGKTEIELKIEKGMRCADAEKYITTSPLSFTQAVPSLAKLEITQVQPNNSDNAETFIEVNTNQAVEMEGIQKLISIKPAVQFKVEEVASGFLVKGIFESGKSYELNISKKLKGILGGEMANDHLSLVPFGELNPSVSFASKKGIYLSAKSSKKVGINIVNLPKIHLTVTKIYENNILQYMSRNRYSRYYGDGEDDYGFNYGDYNLEQMGDVVMDQDYETKDLPDLNGTKLLSVDFDDHSNFKGVYLIRAASKNDYYLRANKLVSVSDIGIITKQADDEIYVFANSIMNMDPMSGVKINFVSTNNQVLHSAVTNADGVAVFSNIKNKFPKFNLGMITARAGKDFNYLLFSDSRVENSRFDVGGLRNNPSGYQAFIYGDREIYRPGETVHINTILRKDQWQTVSDVPMKLKFLMPNGKELTTIKKNLNQQGAFETSIDLPVAAVTGFYTIQVFTGNDVFAGDKTINVEEFVPDRINVVLNTDKNLYSLNDTVVANANAVNLFGPPAAGRNYEIEYYLGNKWFSAKNYSAYNFNIQGVEKLNFPHVVRQGKTDADGKLNEKFVVDPSYRDAGMLSGKVLVTVFDETGRPVNRISNFDVQTQNVFYGIKIPDYYVDTRKNMQIGLIALNKDGMAVENAEAHVQVIKIYWHSVMQRDYDSHYRYVSQREEKIMSDKTLKVGKTGLVFNFSPNESGEYLVRVMRPGSEKYVQSNFYAYGWGYTQNTSFQVNNEGQVDISMDKEKYKPGDEAKILFKTPFSGKMLVTIERDKLYEYYFLTTDKRAASLTLPVKDSYLPNIYITATLFKPLSDDAIPLTVAHGFVPLAVQKASDKLPVTIVAVEKSRSKTKQNITVKTIAKSGVEITVAVVDEGIMQLKNSKTPDPYGFFYQKRGLEVDAYDVYPYLLPDLKLKRSSTGGDGYDLQKRVNPLSNKRVKLVAYWSGILHTNSSGEATCSVDIPQFSGDLRVMAVAYKDRSFGSAEKHIKVADPLVISASVPRFLSPGDTLYMSVTLTNTTAKEMNASATVSFTGPLNVVGSPVQTVPVPANSEKRVSFKVYAQPSVGEASIEVVCNAEGSSYSDKTDITVRPAASLQKINDNGVIAANSSETLNLKTNFIPSSIAGKLLISKSPLAQFSDDLEYLLDYPYGCVEQTTSTVFPQLYYANLIQNLKNKPNHPVNISRNIQAGIARLQSMQMYNGALSYWPGAEEESWWGTCYGGHFLYEAKKAGYDVNQQGLDKMTAYLAAKVKSHPTENYYYYDSNNKEVKKIIPCKDIFYSLYLLAMYAKADIPTMNYYKPKTNEMALDSRYLLAASYLAVGDRKSYNDLLPGSFAGEESVRSFGGNFYSYVRDEAISLNALLETDPDNPQVAVMVQHLSQQMNKRYWYSTQERAFSFLALGKFAKHNSGNTVTATVSTDGKTIAQFKGDDLVIKKDIANKNVTITTSGKGNLYYFWDFEGLDKDGKFTIEDKYLRIRKTFYNRSGQPVTATTVNQNDLIVVKLTLENTERSLVQNVVITDLLPAGFEIENPRVGTVPELSWIKDNAQPDYMDIRDDRINLFTSVDYRQRNFYYLVRAVSTGKFIMGPVSADAMYNGEYHSYNGAGVMKVVEK
ncbi:MAG TPA: alpha-2-macroglobulin [Bacteroidia bacterium]|nr:alpha-2-macroglobulin [Bacteroidia bacterium]